MALFKILKGLSENLSSCPLREGYAYYTINDNGFYIDHYSAENILVRTRINPVMYFENNEIVVSNEGKVIGVLSQAEFNTTINEIKEKQNKFDSSINEIKEQIAQPDWDENDVTSNAYIQNRPFYKETQYTDSSYFNNLIFSQNSEGVYQATFFNQEINFEVGKTYVVDWPEYSVACAIHQNEDGKIYFGNESIATGQEQDNTGEPFFITHDAGIINIYTNDSILPTDITIKLEEVYYHKIEDNYINEISSNLIDEICK